MKQRSDKKKFLGLPLNKYVTIPAILIITIAIIVTSYLGKGASSLFLNAQDLVATNAGWLFILIINIILAFCIFISFSRYGRIRLGGSDAKPEFSTGAWLAMLFSAGMGIGLLFFGVAEPLIHFSENPKTIGIEDPQSAQLAMTFTFLHWGLHGWGLYALVGAALAFFSFNKKQPLALRSAFYPILGNRIHGPLGNVIDTSALIATLFGIATSLGYGVFQFTSGLDYIFHIENTIWVKLISIIIIMTIATLSVYSGINKGVKILSTWNMRIAFLLLAFVVIFGPTTFILRSFVQNIGHYFNNMLEVSLWSESYWGLQEKQLWQNSWTIYYWSWWCSWSPFVGIFIARISLGRTLREFFISVLAIPSLFTFFWMTAFGGTALQYHLLGDGSILTAVQENIGTAIYQFFDHFPFSIVISVITMVLVVSFFVTSADSGALVIDLLASGGRSKTTKGQKVFWSTLIGVVTIVLVINGGLKSLQTMVLLSGLPFAFFLLAMAYSFFKAISMTMHRHITRKKIEKKEKQKAETINEVLEIIREEENGDVDKN